LTVVVVHDDTATDVKQIPAGDAAKDEPVPAESFDKGVTVWFWSHAPVLVSAVAVGGGTTVGVYVEVAVWFVFEVT